VALLRARAALEPTERHHLAYYAAEAALKLAAAGRVALWTRWSGAAGDPRLTVLARPSMGHWAGLLRDLGRILALDGPDHPLCALGRRPRPALRAFLEVARERDVVAKHQLRAASGRLDGVADALVTYRNRVLGHGAQRSGAFYAELGPLLLAAAEELCADPDLLGDLELGRGDDGETWLGDVSLHPLVVERGDRLGVLDHLGRRGVAYLDYATGETFDVDLAGPLRALVGEVVRPQAAVRDIPNRLPQERDSFVGRERDVLRLSHLLDSESLVTLTGPPGTGKTRLAVHTAWSVLPRFEAAWLADLTETRSADDIVTAVARAMDLPLGGGDATDRVGDALAARGHALLVLDNTEHVAAEVAVLVDSWRNMASKVVWLVTSRQPLDLEGETVLALEPLGLEAARELFVARARARSPRFQLTDANRDAVDELVGLLDGLPLALELAAARARVLSPESLLARMRDRFALLAGGRGRHGTLRAAIDASYDPLQPWEKAALTQCSACAGSFTMEAAEAVLDLSTWAEAPWTLDVIQDLVDKSLLRVVDGRVAIDEPSFGMVLSVKEYGGEKLRTPGAVPDDRSGPAEEAAVWERHGAWFGQFGAWDELDALQRHGGLERTRQRMADIDELVLACRRAIARADAPAAAAALLASWAVLELRGPFEQGRELAHAVLGIPGLPAIHEAEARWVLAVVGHLVGIPINPRPALREANEVIQRCGHPVLSLRAGFVVASFDGPPAAHWLRDARDAGDHTLEVMVLGSRARVAFGLGRIDEAIEIHREAAAVARQVGDRHGESGHRVELGMIHARNGDLGAARECLAAGYDLAREAGSLRSCALCRRMQGRVEELAGDPLVARELYAEALVHTREIGDMREALVLFDQARIALWLGEYDELERVANEIGVFHERHIPRAGDASPASVELMWGYAHQLVADATTRAGRLDEAVELWNRVRRVRGSGTECRTADVVECLVAVALQRSGDSLGASQALARAAELVEQTEAEPDRARLVELLRAEVDWWAGRPEEALRLVEAPPPGFDEDDARERWHYLSSLVASG
jgi:predicted ATPase